MDEADFVPETQRQDMAGLRELHRAATPGVRSALGLEWVGGQSFALSVAPGLPETAITLNRGFVAVGAGALRRAAEAYRVAGVKRFFLHVAGDPDREAVRAAGLVRARNWQGFVRTAAPVPPRRPHGFSIRRLEAGEGGDVARIVCDAFDLGDAAQPWLECLPGADGWAAYLSEKDGQPAGAGGLFVRDGRAWTDFGATMPDFRGQGSQGAVLAARIEAAQEAGCGAVRTCTGEAVQGDPQHSYSNILRAGFREESLRNNFAPPRSG